MSVSLSVRAWIELYAPVGMHASLESDLFATNLTVAHASQRVYFRGHAKQRDPSEARRSPPEAGRPAHLLRDTHRHVQVWTRPFVVHGMDRWTTVGRRGWRTRLARFDDLRDLQGDLHRRHGRRRTRMTQTDLRADMRWRKKPPPPVHRHEWTYYRTGVCWTIRKCSTCDETDLV